MNAMDAMHPYDNKINILSPQSSAKAKNRLEPLVVHVWRYDVDNNNVDDDGCPLLMPSSSLAGLRALAMRSVQTMRIVQDAVQESTYSDNSRASSIANLERVYRGCSKVV